MKTRRRERRSGVGAAMVFTAVMFLGAGCSDDDGASVRPTDASEANQTHEPHVTVR